MKLEGWSLSGRTQTGSSSHCSHDGSANPTTRIRINLPIALELLVTGLIGRGSSMLAKNFVVSENSRKTKNEAREDMETGDTARSGTQSGTPPEYETTATDFLSQLAPPGLQLF